MPPLRTTLVLLAAAASVLLWRTWQAQWPAAPAAPVPVASPAAPALPVPAATPPVSNRAAGQPGRREPGPQHLVDLGKRLGFDRELWKAHDFLTVVEAHLAAAQAGDGEAQLLLAEALQYCENVADATAQQDADADTHRQCDGLMAARSRVGDAAHWRDLAAAQGLGAALLQQAADPQRSAGQRLSDFRRALASGDPAVIMLLSFRGPGRPDPADPEAQGRYAETWQAADQLAECKLGYDCSAAGPIYPLFCNKRRDCRYADDIQAYYRRNLRPQRLAEIEQFADRLVSIVRSGSDDWPEAQALEQGILHSDQGGQEAKAPPG